MLYLTMSISYTHGELRRTQKTGFKAVRNISNQSTDTLEPKICCPAFYRLHMLSHFSARGKEKCTLLCNERTGFAFFQPSFLLSPAAELEPQDWFSIELVLLRSFHAAEPQCISQAVPCSGAFKGF